MKHVLALLTEAELEIEDEIKRLQSLPNKNKHLFIKTQERWLEEVTKAKKILIRHSK